MNFVAYRSLYVSLTSTPNRALVATAPDERDVGSAFERRA